MDSNFDNEILHASNARLVEMLREARGEADGFKKLAVAHGNTAAEYGCWLSALKDILLEGKEVSDFEESEPVVRAALDLRREVEVLRENCARPADRGGCQVEKRKRKHLQSIIGRVHEAIRLHIPEWRVANDHIPRHSERSVLAGQIQKIISTPHPETGGVDPSAISDICEHSRSDTPGCPACALKRKRAEFNAKPGGGGVSAGRRRGLTAAEREEVDTYGLDQPENVILYLDDLVKALWRTIERLEYSSCDGCNAYEFDDTGKIDGLYCPACGQNEPHHGAGCIIADALGRPTLEHR